MQRIISTIVILLGLGLLAAGLYLIILGPEGTMGLPKAATLTSGDQEIAFLHPATNIATWERFVAGLKELPGIIVDDSEAFPEDSMKLPVAGLRHATIPGTLWVRWYKLTGLRTIEIWVKELCQRQPPPLAIVGGGNSERARDIAFHLSRQQAALPNRKLPLFLITTATADRVQHADLGEIDLMNIYPNRSLRYCFTNKQMAESICDFVREHLSQDRNLRTSFSLARLMTWQDDPFSIDLAEQFEEQWKLPSDAAIIPDTKRYTIGHSVGGLNRPNKLEIAAVGKLISDARDNQIRGRELLVLPGGPAPARRVLRSLYRTDPIERNFWVVTVADAVDWNTLYRDRRITWPIEDIPFPLIAFMHRNPVETKLSPGRGFVPDSITQTVSNPTGTDDLLLYRDIGQSFVSCCFSTSNSTRLLSDPDELLKLLNEQKDAQGLPLFDEHGNRPSRAGEFMTLLQPVYNDPDNQAKDQQVLPRSKITVYERQANNTWRLVIELFAEYTTSRSVP